MPTRDELLNAIGNRLADQIAQNATSDTILKLAEAWAWVAEPGQAHGGQHYA